MGLFNRDLAQQALMVAQQALTIIKEHKDYCETSNEQRIKRETEREEQLQDRLRHQDAKMDSNHKENAGSLESMRNEASARGRWIIGLLLTALIGIAGFFLQSHK